VEEIGVASATLKGQCCSSRKQITSPDASIKSLTNFIADAKTNPGKTSVASFGVGSTSHLAQELLKMMTGINIVHVPYRGDASALTDTMISKSGGG